MSITIDIYLAPGPGKSLTSEAFLGVVEALIRRDLVVPPYRVFLGKKGAAEGLSIPGRCRMKPSKIRRLEVPTQLTHYYPPLDHAPPEGIVLVYEGDEVPALRSAIEGCDFLRKSVFVTFLWLNWETETIRERRRKVVIYRASVLLLSSPEELEFKDNHEDIGPVEWVPERFRRQKIACHQCAVLVSNSGAYLENVPGSVVEDFFGQQFGTPLQMVMRFY